MQHVQSRPRIHGQHCRCGECGGFLDRQSQYRVNVGAGLFCLAVSAAVIVAIPGRSLLTLIGRAVGLNF